MQHQHGPFGAEDPAPESDQVLQVDGAQARLGGLLPGCDRQGPAQPDLGWDAQRLLVPPAGRGLTPHCCRVEHRPQDVLGQQAQGPVLVPAAGHDLPGQTGGGGLPGELDAGAPP